MRFSALRLSPLALLWIACSSSGDGAVHLAPNLIFPSGLLDGVTKLTVSVYDPAGDTLTCNPMDGTVTGLTTQQALAKKDLNNTGCPSNAKFCGDISIAETSDARLFTAQAFVGGNTVPIASGCTKAAPDKDTLQVSIQMLRSLPPAMCNGMVSPVQVQCSAPGDASDPVCDPNCLTKEEYFSKGDGVTTGDSKAKVRPQLVWPGAMGDPGRLFGAWGDKSNANAVAVRVLDDMMEPYTGSSMCVQTSSFRMPAMSGAPCPGQPYPQPQFNPTIASVNGNYYIAFEDTTSGATSIKIRGMDNILDSIQSNAVQVSDASVLVAQALPSMAANGTNLFVAWENQGTIAGKIVDSGTLMPAAGNQKSLGSGTGVSVAATSNGWVAVYSNGSDVEMVTIDSTGTPGTPSKVNDGTHSGAQQHPSVAAFGANIAVVWLDTGSANGGNVVVQRFDTSGKPLAGDQATAIQDPTLSGAQASPSIAAGTNFFVATWVDSTSGHVRARFLDGTGGYMFNGINGQSTDCQVSTVDGNTRDNPVAAVGGAGPSVSIAWEDNTGSPSAFRGIWGRRVPTPM